MAIIEKININDSQSEASRKVYDNDLRITKQAETAELTAKNAATAAGEAKVAARNAQTTADNAQKAANSAQSTADNATALAEKAQKTADEAKTEAGNAMSEAESKADKTDADGNEVVYAPNGVIEVPEDLQYAVKVIKGSNSVAIEQSSIKSYVVTGMNIWVTGNTLNTSTGTQGNAIHKMPLEAGYTYSFVCPYADRATHPFIIFNTLTNIAIQYVQKELTYTAKAGDTFCMLVKWGGIDFTELTQEQLRISKGSGQKMGYIPSSLLMKYQLDNTNVFIPGNASSGNLVVGWAGGAKSIVKYPLTEGVEYIFKSPYPANSETSLHPFIIFNALTDIATRINDTEFVYTAKAGDTFCMLTKYGSTDFSDLTFDKLNIYGDYTIDAIAFPDIVSVDANDLIFSQTKERGTKKIAITATETGITSIQQGASILVDMNNAGGKLAYTEKLEGGYVYELDLGKVLKGMVGAALRAFNASGTIVKTVGIACGGRRKVYIDIPQEAGISYYVLYFNYVFNGAAWKERIEFDITGKYKVTRLGRSTKELVNPQFESLNIRNVVDFSDRPNLCIAEPEWIVWNVYEDYAALCAVSANKKARYIVEYTDSNGVYFRKKAQVDPQGSSSINWLNRNSKYKLENEDGTKFFLQIGNWLPRSTFHIKVNWVDFSQCKNLGGARFVYEWYKDDPDKKFPWEQPYNRTTATFEQTFWNGARAVIAGIPCIITTYKNHYCNGTFNLNAFAENFMLSEDNPLHRGYRGGDGNHLQKSQWEEMVSGLEGDEMTDEVWQPMADFMAWYKTNSSTDNLQAYKDADGVRYDKSDMIDFYLFAEFCLFTDNGFNNMVWVSYDSVKFTPGWYDMDTQLGNTWNGSYWKAPNSPFVIQQNNYFWWSQLLRAYPDEMKVRYHDLRKKGIFSLERILKIYGGIIDTYKFEWYNNDYYMWKTDTRPSVQVGNITSKDFIKWWMGERIVYLDNKYGYNG